MPTRDQELTTGRTAGYAALIERFALEVIPNWHRSWVSQGSARRIERLVAGEIEEYYPAIYWPGDKLGDHLEFALKYDGTNLAILAAVFGMAPKEELETYVRSKPTGKYARRIWFLYEFLTGTTLAVDDLSQGNYVDLLVRDQYWTATPSRPMRRQRINDNLLGDARFCPTVRRTDELRGFEEADLTERCKQVVSTYSPELLKRALSYLYTKETKSSFEIENIKPNSTRTERFIALLRLAEKDDFCDKPHLIELQNQIVEPRFKDSDYRKLQNYVGQSVAWGAEKVHFACPKPTDLEALMGGLLNAHERMEASKTHPVIHAAAIAYGFVFLHPFEDGNGRIHRFLIHNILARRNFTPTGLMFPVSASMRKNLAEYDASLEAFSRPLMPLVQYEIDDDGRMTVTNDTCRWYAFIDMTAQVEALFRFIKHTIETELVEELSFLAKYDAVKRAIQAIIDMPDLKIDLFIRFCLQNNGRLSDGKRKSHFDFLSDDEIEKMQKTIEDFYRSGSTRG